MRTAEEEEEKGAGAADRYRGSDGRTGSVRKGEEWRESKVRGVGLHK